MTDDFEIKSCAVPCIHKLCISKHTSSRQALYSKQHALCNNLCVCSFFSGFKGARECFPRLAKEWVTAGSKQL